MELTIRSAIYLAIAIIAITAAVTKIARGRRRTSDLACNRPPPPVVNCFALLGLLPTLFRNDLPAMMHQLYIKFGSVFTISVVGLLKVTFLVGPEVSAHFFQGLESEISHGNLFEFSVPMFGKEVGHGVDDATRNEHSRFVVDALKPTRLKIHVDPMVQEVENYFAKWGQHGTIDLKYELERLLLLITGRCILGKEVMTMFDEVCKQFREIENGVNLTSFFFPYSPVIPSNHRRDRAREKLHSIFSDIVRSRKLRQRDQVDKDVLQSLIDSRYKDGRPTTEAEVSGLIISLLFAAKHTSTHTSVWTGARLLTHDKFLAAAVAEQDHVVKKHSATTDGRIIDHYSFLMDMNMLHNCIKEALRLHPPAPMMVRQAQKQFIVRTREGDEYCVPAGHTIASPIVINNHMPYIYKDAHLYDPDRFGPGREEDKVGGKFSYTSFGGGRNSCVGEGYAYMQIKAIWSHLLGNFELRLLSPFPKTDWSKLVPEPQGEVMVSYKRRQLPTT